MDNKTYEKNALVTDLRDYAPVAGRLLKTETIRLLHASIGLQTESGEIADALKRHIFYGKELDKVNIVEEAGDLLWYVSVALSSVGSSFDEAMEKNIAKLKARYGDKFSEEAAVERDLGKERSVLEATHP